MESVYGLVEAAALEVWTTRCQRLLRASMFAEGRSEVLGPFPPHHDWIGGQLGLSKDSFNYISHPTSLSADSMALLPSPQELEVQISPLDYA